MASVAQHKKKKKNGKKTPNSTQFKQQYVLGETSWCNHMN